MAVYTHSERTGSKLNGHTYVLITTGQSGKWQLRSIVIVNMRFNMRTQSNICENMLLYVLDPNKMTVIRFQTPIKTHRTQLAILHGNYFLRSGKNTLEKVIYWNEYT